MKRIGVWLLVAIGVAFAIALAALVAPHASKAPDGLEKVAEEKGFPPAGAQVWKHAPAPDYTTPGVENDWLTTAIAGVLGTLIVFGAALGMALLLKRRSPKEPLDTERESSQSEGRKM